jgi:hypothetical protein
MPEFILAENITAVQSSEYYGNKNSIIEKLNEGEAAVFFGGHGHNEVFTHESLFVAEDVDLLTNINKSFFVSIVGAQRFSRKDKSSIVNEMILSENGALASINSVGSHFFTASENYYNEIWRQLFSDITIGEILMNANNKTGNSTEKRKYNLFGDPSIVLKTVQPTGQFFEDELVSESFRLHQNYPNPFNPTTTIKYTLPFGVNSESSIVKIKIFDLLGREIETLVNEIQKPGNYEIEWNAADKPSGVYFYRLQAGGLSETRKMILSK